MVIHDLDFLVIGHHVLVLALGVGLAALEGVPYGFGIHGFPVVKLYAFAQFELPGVVVDQLPAFRQFRDDFQIVVITDQVFVNVPLNRGGCRFIPPVRVERGRIPLEADDQWFFRCKANRGDTPTIEKENKYETKKNDFFHYSSLLIFYWFLNPDDEGNPILK
jgi:hypothetical protein